MNSFDEASQTIDRPWPPPADAGTTAGEGPGLVPQCGGGGCGCSGGASKGEGPAGLIYALGRVEPRIPSRALEKEFAQATGRASTAGLSDRQALHEVLAQRPNRYLAR